LIPRVFSPAVRVFGIAGTRSHAGLESREDRLPQRTTGKKQPGTSLISHETRSDAAGGSVSVDLQRDSWVADVVVRPGSPTNPQEHRTGEHEQRSHQAQPLGVHPPISHRPTLGRRIHFVYRSSGLWLSEFNTARAETATLCTNYSTTDPRRPTHFDPSPSYVSLDSAIWGRPSAWLSSWASALSMIVAKASISSGVNASKTRRRTVLT
jgi:hypothetical protein